MAKRGGGDGNAGGRPMDDYIADTGKMDSPWFGGDSDDRQGSRLMKAAPSVKGMDGQGGKGIRDGLSGANDKGGAGRTPG